jgi:16S rRNA A1518/A1519 N6-dimethyltransferase RsmA/KsgA/DIM1 with predicted DNA glycosylase/AP lyase activity
MSSELSEWIYLDHSDVRQLADSDYSDRLNAFRTFFFRVVKAGFSAPRKQLLGNLSKGLKVERDTIEDCLKKGGISPRQRAETLNIEDWIKLTSLLIPILNS